MTIELELKGHKRNSVIKLNGEVLRKYVMNFDVRIIDSIPEITLLLRPDVLKISGEVSEVTIGDLQRMRDKSGRRALKAAVKYACYCLFRSIRLAKQEVIGIWKTAHPSNKDAEYVYRPWW